MRFRCRRVREREGAIVASVMAGACVRRLWTAVVTHELAERGVSHVRCRLGRNSEKERKIDWMDIFCE